MMKPFYGSIIVFLVVIWPTSSSAGSKPTAQLTLLDDFDGPLRWKLHKQGETDVKLQLGPESARDGKQGLSVGISASEQEKPRHATTLLLEFEIPQDWSQYEGVQFYARIPGDFPSDLWVRLHEKAGGRYRCRVENLKPELAGEWQLSRISFDDMRWDFESKSDPNSQLDLHEIVAISLWLTIPPGQKSWVELDDMNLFAKTPPYEGPQLRLRPAAPAGLFDAGQSLGIQAEAIGMKPGQAGSVRFAAVDFWDKKVAEGAKEFVADGNGRAVVAFELDGVGYFNLKAALLLDGKEIWEEEQSIAALAPLSEKDAAPNPDSIFGIWVGGLVLPHRLGVKWGRGYCQPWDFEPNPETGGYKYVCKTGEEFKLNLVPGVNYCFYFRGMPDWLTSRPGRPDSKKFPPKDWSEYARFIKFYVGLTKDQVKYWEVWNEPVPYANWMGTIEDVVKLHEVTYRAVKEADPSATVIGPCPFTFKWDFLDRFFELGGANWIDEISVHAYPPRRKSPEEADFAGNLRRLKEYARKYGKPERIWITELGYDTKSVREVDQANYLVRSYVLAMSEGVRVLIWHMWWDYNDEGLEGGHGIFRYNHSPKPALVALATLIRTLERARFVSAMVDLSEGAMGYTFEKDGRTIQVVWSPVQQRRIRVKWDRPNAVIRSIMGGDEKASPAKKALDLEIGPSPIFVLESE